MAAVNRPTHKQNSDDFINRQPPFDSDPLIQKSEDDIIRDEMADSAVFRVAEVAAIGTPAAAFNADFTTADRIDVDSTGEGTTSFVITLVGLNDNETGIINITKKSGDTFTFSNGLITPFNNTSGQDGQTSIVFFVKIIASTYVVQAGFDISAVGGDLQGNYPNLTLKNNVVEFENMTDDSVGENEIIDDSIDRNHIKSSESISLSGPTITGGFSHRSISGSCQLEGTVNVSSIPTTINISAVLDRFRPIFSSEYYIDDAVFKMNTSGFLSITDGSTGKDYDISSINYLNGN